MSDSEITERYRLVPVDKSGLVYLGINVTNGKQAALFISYHDEFKPPKQPGERTLDDWLHDLLGHIGLRWRVETQDVGYLSTVEFDNRTFWAIPWTKEFDHLLVGLIDLLIGMRMKNASVVSMTLQLEMPMP